MKSSLSKGFTLIELIFVIVIIGVLTSVAIPKFKNLTDNSKISSELATASSVQSALDAIHGDWITNTCTFKWGTDQDSNNSALFDNTAGYPIKLGSSNTTPFDYILKNANNGDWVKGADGFYRGPATRTDGKGAKDRNLPNKPEGNDYWDYNATAGTFTLREP